MFDSSTLTLRNEYRTLERILPHKYGPYVEILQAPWAYTRFCYKTNRSQSIFDSCLIVDKYGKIISVYTAPSMRRRKMAKQLLAIAKDTLRDIKHSDNLTTLGRLWRDSVEGLTNLENNLKTA